MSKLFKQSGSDIRVRSIDLWAPGNTRAIKLVGGDGGTTFGSRIMWSHGVGGPANEVYLDSSNTGQIICRSDAGTFGIRSKSDDGTEVDPFATAVLDTDTHADPLFAAAHVILQTQFHRTRLSDGGQLLTDDAFEVYPGFPASNGQPALRLTTYGMYLNQYRTLGNWSDAHPIHFIAVGPMSATPDPTVFRPQDDPLGETGDRLDIDFHVNDELGNLIDPKPCIYVQNIDNLNARITMADKHPVEFESALIRLGKGHVDLEAIDPTWAPTNLTRGSPFRLRLDGFTHRLTLSIDDVDRAAFASYGFFMYDELSDFVGGISPDTLFLSSPNGVMWQITVSDTGVLSTEVL